LLSPIHVSYRDHANQLAPDREGDEQLPAAARLPQGVVPLSALRMPNVTVNDQGLAEKDIFGFFRGDLMPLPVLLSIRFIPLEAGTSA
jgi:hypothetical protein